MAAELQTVPLATLMSAEETKARGVYVDSCLRIEHQRYYLAVKDVPVKLTRTEFRIVSFLVSNINQIVRLEDLWKAAWDANKSFNRKSIHVFVSRVRRKLAPHGLRIASVVEVGYILTHDRCCRAVTHPEH